MKIRFRLFGQADSADVMAQVGPGSYDTAMDYASALSFTGIAGLAGSGHSGMYDANSSGVGNAGFYLASDARKNPALPVAGTIELIGASVPGIEHYGRAWVTALVPFPLTRGTAFALVNLYQHRNRLTPQRADLLP
ncbi:MAG: hypothetical protein WCC26_20335 [Terracidiphilus sp.]